MGLRGKQIAAPIAQVETLRQPLPVPEGFPPDEARIWRSVVNARPVGYFDGGSAPVLAEYVRVVARLDRLAARLGSIPEDAPARRDIEAAQEAGGRALLRLGTALRLTVLSYRGDRAATSAKREAERPELWKSNG